MMMARTRLLILLALSVVIIASTTTLGPMVNLPLSMSVFNLPGTVANSFNISSDSVAFYAIWGFFGTIVALIFDILMFIRGR